MQRSLRIQQRGEPPVRPVRLDPTHTGAPVSCSPDLAPTEVRPCRSFPLSRCRCCPWRRASRRHNARMSSRHCPRPRSRNPRRLRTARPHAQCAHIGGGVQGDAGPGHAPAIGRGRPFGKAPWRGVHDLRVNLRGTEDPDGRQDLRGERGQGRGRRGGRRRDGYPPDRAAQRLHHRSPCAGFEPPAPLAPTHRTSSSPRWPPHGRRGRWGSAPRWRPTRRRSERR